MTRLNSNQLINIVQDNFLRKGLPNIKVGDTVKIGVKIIEGNKERVQFYEGIVIAKKNSLINTTITVRKVLQGIGIERVFLIHSPKTFDLVYWHRKVHLRPLHRSCATWSSSA